MKNASQKAASTHLRPVKTLDQVEQELRGATHARKRFELSLELCRYMRRDLPRMLTLARSALDIVQQNPRLGQFRRAKALWWVAYSNRLLQDHEQSIRYFEESIQVLSPLISDDPSNDAEAEITSFSIELFDNAAIEYFHTGNLEKALQYFTKALQIAERLEISGGIVATHNSLGELWRTVGSIEKAYIHWTTALNVSFQTGDLRRLAELYTNLAWTQEYYGEEEKAVELIEKALPHARQYDNPYGICTALLCRSRLSISSKNWLAIEADITECLTLAKAYNYLGVETEALLIRAQVNLEQGSVTIARNTYELIYRNVKKRNEIQNCIASALGVARCYRLHQHYKKATTWVLTARQHAEALGSAPALASCILEQADIERLRGQAERSNQYLRDYISVVELINKEQHTSDIREARLRLSLESTERERRELAARNSELERDLEKKLAEVSSLALSISQKNAVIEKLAKHIDALMSSSNGILTDGCKSISSEITLLRNSGEEQWTNLQAHFESIDNDFQQKLTREFPSLSQIEVRICLLMRLQLATKDISSILWTSPRTVETQRYSIRRKLGLSKAENLSQFLSRL